MDNSDLKILYLTQSVDENNHLLRAFYQWLNLLAARVAQINVICLKEGAHSSLEKNVKVFSLGKERGEGKSGYLRNFYKTAWPLFKKGEVDVVFAHMTEINVLLIWPLAFLFKKPIIWWKAHGHLSFKSKIAARLASTIVTSSAAGFPLKTKKRVIVGQGIDASHFRFKSEWPAEIRKIIFVGRISPVKHLETLIGAAKILIKDKNYPLRFEIIGEPPLKSQESYLENLKNDVSRLDLGNYVQFIGAVPHQQILSHYQSADVLVNTSSTGSLDKTVLEAMACGTLAVNSNRAFEEIFKDLPICQFQDKNERELAEKIEAIMKMSPAEREAIGRRLRTIVVENHNLDNLINRLIDIFTAYAKKSHRDRT